jgi:HlyD family secretion protein
LSVSHGMLEGRAAAGLFTRERLVPLGLGLLAVLLAFLIAHDVFFPPGPASAAVNTATVQRGTVRSAVSGTGTVVPAQQQSVGFTQSGTLAEVDVKVGDHVAKGQVMARLDTTQLQQALTQADNGLTQAQATLNSTLNSNALTQAQHGLANAQQSLADSQASVNLVNQQDANQQLQDTATLGQDSAALQTAQQNLAGGNCSSATPATNCSQLQTAATQAQSTVNADNNKVNSDNNKIATDKLSGQRSINQANQAITTAQDNLNSQTISRPNTIASQQAAVSNAQLAVQTAQRNLDLATLSAPFDGTVMSVTGQVGESAGGGTALAPGTTAPLPGSSGGGSTGGGGAASSSGSAGSGSGGGGFIVLSNVSALEVVAPFAEADASRVQANQQATITFDAITGLTEPAHVLAVAQSGTVVSNVTNYYATLVLDNLDQRLKTGMTANANVVVQQAQNVLTVPNSVVTRLGTLSFVTLLGRDGKTQTRQAVQTGAVGDTSTEIMGGLNEGDRVVRPTLRTGAAAAGGAGAAGGRGAGGLGGGGGGGGAVRIGGG